MKLTGKSIIVTGGCGHIGSHLCAHLIKLGNKVTIIDDFSNNVVDAVDQSSILKMHYKDIDKLDNVTEFQYLFHLGEYSRVEQSLTDFYQCCESNMHIHNILNFCHARKIKLIYAGSSTKFSKDVHGSLLSPYTFTKFFNTELVSAYSNWYGLDHAIVYFHNVYGGNERSCGKYATVVAKFLSLAKEGALTLPVTMPGTQKRNFTHIDDTISGLIKVAEYGEGDGYGIASNESITILELVEMIGLQPEFRLATSANRMDTEIHNEKLKSLGWLAKNTLEKYIRDELAYLCNLRVYKQISGHQL